jgi:hypothetical protein
MAFSFDTRLLDGGNMKFNWYMTIMFDSEEYWAKFGQVKFRIFSCFFLIPHIFSCINLFLSCIGNSKASGEDSAIHGVFDRNGG